MVSQSHARLRKCSVSRVKRKQPQRRHTASVAAIDIFDGSVHQKNVETEKKILFAGEKQKQRYILGRKRFCRINLMFDVGAASDYCQSELGHLTVILPSVCLLLLDKLLHHTTFIFRTAVQGFFHCFLSSAANYRGCGLVMFHFILCDPSWVACMMGTRWSEQLGTQWRKEVSPYVETCNTPAREESTLSVRILHLSRQLVRPIHIQKLFFTSFVQSLIHMLHICIPSA